MFLGGCEAFLSSDEYGQSHADQTSGGDGSPGNIVLLAAVPDRALVRVGDMRNIDIAGLHSGCSRSDLGAEGEHESGSKLDLAEHDGRCGTVEMGERGTLEVGWGLMPYLPLLRLLICVSETSGWHPCQSWRGQRAETTCCVHGQERPAGRNQTGHPCRVEYAYAGVDRCG